MNISIHAPLAGRDRWVSGYSRYHIRYFNPRAPCGARLSNDWSEPELGHFNPRAPCGARLSRKSGLSMPAIFQSTRPLRGATQ